MTKPMTISRSLVVTCTLGVILALATGCGAPTAPPAVPRSAADVDGHHRDHDHAAGEHDHAVGGHAHGPGPHGGTVADWGGGTYHVEFTVDHDARESVIYVFGGDEKTPAAVRADDGRLLLTVVEPAFQVELVARPLDGEVEGAASRYVGRHESLGIVREFAGTISGAVDGTPYAGDFKETAHAHE
jgi:hypothetical protein